MIDIIGFLAKISKKKKREREHPNKVETILEMSAERNTCSVFAVINASISNKP